MKFNREEKNSFDHKQPVEYKEKRIEEASILVAEDNMVNQILIKKFLKKWHIGKLFIASDGQEALEEFDQSNFDILLLDIQMPLLDGFSVARLIRENKNSSKSQIPIVILSASSHDEIKREMGEFGIDGFIEKPFTSEDLYGKLSEYLKSKDLS